MSWCSTATASCSTRRQCHRAGEGFRGRFAGGGCADRADAVDKSRRTDASAEHSGIESIYQALLLGLRDYVRKCGFKSVVLGLSGGIDSALTAALAVAALGKDKVVGVAMPSRFSSDHSMTDARQLAENLGIAFHIVPIEQLHEAYEQTLAPAFAGRPPDVTEENLQARIRGALLMAFSNKFNHLLLTTGNKSELAVGYCTLYGDMCGGLAVISDVPKTTVWELSRWINQHAGRELIPQSSIDKVPSGRASAESDRSGFAAAVRCAGCDFVSVCGGGEGRGGDHRRGIRCRDGDAGDSS